MPPWEALRELDHLGISVRIGPAGEILVPRREALRGEAAPLFEVLRGNRARLRPCLSCGAAVDAAEVPGLLFCSSCWALRQEAREGRLLVLDDERLRRFKERAARTASALAERYCEACGFSFWRVSPRGDASCYGCELIREGKPLRCAGCGLEEWRRDERGHAECATCAGGDARVAAPSAVAPPGAAARGFSPHRGAG